MLSQWLPHTSHSLAFPFWSWLAAARAYVYPCNLYAALVLEKKIQLFLKQHGTGNPDLTKEENIVTYRLVFAAIF